MVPLVRLCHNSISKWHHWYPSAIRVSRGGSTGTLFLFIEYLVVATLVTGCHYVDHLVPYLVMASLVPWCHNNISCCTAYLVSLQFLLADPVVLSVISVSRSSSTGSLVSTDYLMVAFLVPSCHISNSRWLHWYPSDNTISLRGFTGPLVQ